MVNWFQNNSKMYCPKLDNNLFSLPIMKWQGFDMKTQDDRMYFVKNTIVTQQSLPSLTATCTPRT